MRSFFIALQFLTLFPIKKDFGAGHHELMRSMAWFPVVGLVQGILAAIAYLALSPILPESIIAGLIILVLVLSNGGLHLDGFADTVDGLAGGKDAEERLRIMKDSAVGAIGVVFLILLLLIKYIAIEEILLTEDWHLVALFPVIGRWAMVPMACWAPYARKEGGLGLAFANNERPALFVSTIFALIISVLFLNLPGIALVGIMLVVVYLITGFFKNKLGGVTGDVFGFQSETAEALCLVLLLI